jgi:transposase
MAKVRHAASIRIKVCFVSGAVAELVGIRVGVVSGVMNLESSGVEAPDWRPRHDEHYHEA